MLGQHFSNRPIGRAFPGYKVLFFASKFENRDSFTDNRITVHQFVPLDMKECICHFTKSLSNPRGRIGCTYPANEIGQHDDDEFLGQGILVSGVVSLLPHVLYRRFHRHEDHKVAVKENQLHVKALRLLSTTISR